MLLCLQDRFRYAVNSKMVILLLQQELALSRYFPQKISAICPHFRQFIRIETAGVLAIKIREMAILARLCKLFHMVMNMTRIINLDDSSETTENDDASSRTETSLKGEPYLIISTTSSYTKVYSDQGTGAKMDVSIFRPNPSDPSYFIVGDYAQGNHNSGPAGTSLIVKAINDDNSEMPLLKAPVDYVQIWNDKGTGGRYDGSIWQPVPPDGYVALGSVAQEGYGKPTISNYRCLRHDLTVTTQAGTLIWDDKGSGGSMDVELWNIVGDKGLFKAQGNYQPPSGDFLKISGT